MNLGWIDDERAQDLFRRIDREGWEFEGRDPAPHARHRVAGAARGARRRHRLHRLATVGPRRARAQRCRAPRWFQAAATDSPLRDRSPTSPPSSASPPRSRSTPAASACSPATTSRRPTTSACPLIAIGLFYRHGYFRQDARPPGLAAWSASPASTPAPWRSSRSPDVRITVDLAGVPVHARLWQAQVGRIALYLLDTDIDENDDEQPPHHRPPLRRRRRGAHPPGDRARHRRRAGARGARHAAPGVPHERGPRRLPGPRAHPPGHGRRRPLLRRGQRPRCGPARCSPPTRRCRPASTASRAS